MSRRRLINLDDYGVSLEAFLYLAAWWCLRSYGRGYDYDMCEHMRLYSMERYQRQNATAVH